MRAARREEDDIALGIVNISANLVDLRDRIHTVAEDVTDRMLEMDLDAPVRDLNIAARDEVRAMLTDVERLVHEASELAEAVCVVAGVDN